MNKKNLLIALSIFLAILLILVGTYFWTRSGKITQLADYKIYAQSINSIDDMVRYMGYEVNDIGSGLAIYQYPLEDGEISYSFTMYNTKPVSVSCYNLLKLKVDCYTLVAEKKGLADLANYELLSADKILMEVAISFETAKGDWYLFDNKSLYSLTIINQTQVEPVKILDFPQEINIPQYYGDFMSIPYYVNEEDNALIILSYAPYYEKDPELGLVKSSTSLTPTIYRVDLGARTVLTFTVNVDDFSKLLVVESLTELGNYPGVFEKQYAICGTSFLQGPAYSHACFIADLETLK